MQAQAPFIQPALLSLQISPDEQGSPRPILRAANTRKKYLSESDKDIYMAILHLEINREIINSLNKVCFGNTAVQVYIPQIPRLSK